MAAGDEMTGHDDGLPMTAAPYVRLALHRWNLGRYYCQRRRDPNLSHTVEDGDGGYSGRIHIFGGHRYLPKKPRKVPFLKGNYGWFSGKVDGN